MSQSDRLSLWGEIRWYIAAVLLGWIIRLVEREASPHMLQAIHDLALGFVDRPRLSKAKP